VFPNPPEIQNVPGGHFTRRLAILLIIK